ncbi:DUF3060 domain-containing protein [Xanthobacter sp. TB0136]|uniref:DUF3060 domain-containing protein n=1 Tax=Xanthobacter sp. TB0136 TaxID=3459177 RepID=UPI00403A7484
MKTGLSQSFSPFLLLLALGAPAVAQADAGQGDEEPQIVIEGQGLSRDVPCGGSSVGIYGAENTVALTGDCGAVFVHGKGHVVRFEKAGEVVVTGVENRITGGEATGLAVASASNQVETAIRPAEGSAAVEVAGADHVVKLKLAGPTVLDVAGVKNKVSWALQDGAPDPRIDISGAMNDVKRAP